MGVGSSSGITTLLGADVLVPPAPVADTVQVYDLPGVTPVTISGDDVPVAVPETPPLVEIQLAVKVMELFSKLVDFDEGVTVVNVTVILLTPAVA